MEGSEGGFLSDVARVVVNQVASLTAAAGSLGVVEEAECSLFAVFDGRWSVCFVLEE